MSNCCSDTATLKVLKDILAAIIGQEVGTIGDVTSITDYVNPGYGATNLGKKEDNPHASGDIGVLALAVRNDANAVLTSTDLDNSPIAVDSAGRIKLSAAVTITDIANITTSVTPGTGTGNLGKAEDAVATSGDTGVLALVVQTATPASTAADGDYVWLKTDALGKLWTAQTQTEDAASASGDRGAFVLAVRNDAAGTTLAGTDLDYSGISVDSTGRVFINPGVAATSLGKAEDAAHTSGDTGVMALAVRNDSLAVMAGTDLDYIPLVSNSRGVLHVDLITGTTSAWKAEDLAATDGDTVFTAGFVREDTPASNTSVTGDYTWGKTDSLGKIWTADNQSEDAVAASGDRGSFVLGVIQATPAAGAADGDYGAFKLTALGGVFSQSQLAADADSFNAVSPADITNTTSTALLAAGGANVRRYICSLTVSNMHATVGTRVDLLDGATVIWQGPAAANGGGFTITFPQPLRCTANTAVNLQCATTNTATRGAIAGFNRSY